MTQDRKRRLAEELLNLRDFETPPDMTDYPDFAKDAYFQFMERKSALLVNLYIEHFTEDQLQTQLDYYRSEPGRSILDAHTRIAKDIERLLPEMLSETSDSEPIPDDGRQMVRLTRSNISRRKNLKDSDEGDA